jgi:hypothetical protein
MNVEISVPEVIEIFKEIKEQPERLFEMIRFDIQETVGKYLTAMMNAELSHFLGREPYERSPGEPNHRAGPQNLDRGLGEIFYGLFSKLCCLRQCIITRVYLFRAQAAETLMVPFLIVKPKIFTNALFGFGDAFVCL